MAIPKIPYIAAAALLLAALRWGVSGPAEGARLSQEPLLRTEIVYLPSPLETEMLLSGPAVWPKLFSKERPPLPDRIPELYTTVFREGRFSKISGKDLEKARSWSALLNGLHLKQLRARLEEEKAPEKLLSRGKRDGGCSLMDRELLYRWTQLRSELKPRFAEYLEECKDKSVFADWVRLEVAIKRKNGPDIRRLGDKLRLRSFIPDKSWTQWFAGELVRIAELKGPQQAAEEPSSEEQSKPRSEP